MDSANRKKRRLIMVSFDAVTSAEAEEKLWQMPNFRCICGKGNICRRSQQRADDRTLMLCTGSVITGCLPEKQESMITFLFSRMKRIRCGTIGIVPFKRPRCISRRKKAGLRCAGILWPVSAGARMRWNMPGGASRAGAESGVGQHQKRKLVLSAFGDPAARKADERHFAAGTG